jgi:hypothetical protein
MGYVLYVGFAIHRRATVRIHLYFKRLMFKQMICIKKKKKKKKKKKRGRHTLLMCLFSYMMQVKI